MFKKSIILTFLTLLTLSLNAQDTGKDKKPWDFDFYGKEYFYKSRPTVDITYGASRISLKNSDVNFNDAGLIEVKLGYTYLEKSIYSKSISRYESNFLYGSYISSKINTKKISGAEDRTWRFGIGNANGYGYVLGKKSSLILYNSGSLTWTRYQSGIGQTSIMEDGFDKPINAFERSLRFGTTTEAGIIVPIAGFVNLQAQYDRTIVFPRHLFWKHLGSMMIEAIGQTAVDGFVKAIMKSSPTAGPILNFLLKNALSYGLYELRREKMNWPFNSTEPLLFDSFKAGFTFTF